AGRMLSGQELALEAESARERAHHAIDRASFLRAAREVDAADDELGFELRRGERGFDELHEAVAQERELLGEAVEQRASRGVALRRRLLKQVGDADCHQHAVDRPPGARLLEELEKALPGGRVDVPVTLLCGVPPGRIEEDGLVGEPPIAVPSAADTTDSFAAKTIREREAQARVDQRSRLAGARSAD